jgi:salicylate hydroxylase
VAPARSVIIAGAGIGGLTLALMLARKGFDVTLFELAERLEETGAGIQLSPNATHILRALGLSDRLKADVVVPEAVHMMAAKTGRELARVPLGQVAESRYRAPYWIVHRGDLQTALLRAIDAEPRIALNLGMRIEDYAAHPRGISVRWRHRNETGQEQGLALVGADGLWSRVHTRLGGSAPRFRHRTAWRAVAPAEGVAPPFREPAIHLWLGRNAHLVHYPVMAGVLINIVAIVRDDWKETGWTAAAARDEILARFPQAQWAEPARMLLEVPKQWLKWALFDRAPLRRWGDGRVTLLGDAAHPMLPFLAQGAAMAIEDAFILSECMGNTPNDLAGAMRRYEQYRKARTARTQRAARRNGRVYHLGGLSGAARNGALRVLSGERLLARYDWLYSWRAT